VVTLADTSAWIEFDRATNSAVDLRLTDLIESSQSVFVTEPVTMELLIGARGDADERRLRRLLARFELAGFDPTADFAVATRIYQRCRQAGYTPRGLIDCLIAAVAWRVNAALLTTDADLIRIAEVVGIGLDEASTSAQ
jgi:predicted nucleic acid-binding protein